MTGSIELTKARSAPTLEWTPSSSFNETGFAGLGLAFDPQRWNVYRLLFDMWSSGGIQLAVLHPQCAEFVPLHTWRPAAGADRFETAVPYGSTVRSRCTSDASSAASGPQLAGGSASGGIPATAGLRSRLHKQYVKDSVTLSASADSLVGVLCSPVVNADGIRNGGIATVYRVSVTVKSSVDVVAGVTMSGVATQSLDTARFLAFSCLEAGDAPAGDVYVSGGFRYTSAFVSAGNEEAVEVECDQLWLMPGKWCAVVLRPARAADAGAVVQTVAATVAWYET